MRSEFFVGLDLGKRQDYSAAAVLERVEVPGERDGTAFGYRTETALRLRYLERMPLGTAYPAVVDRAARLMSLPAMAAGRRHLLVDATGVGAPVVDLLRKEKLPCRLWPVLITSGAASGMTKGFYTAPKHDLTVGLQLLFREGRLKIASKLTERTALVKELVEMRVRMTTGGHDIYSAPSGGHDDLVMALALACWGLRQVRPGDGEKRRVV